jgi:putative membrane protein
MGFWHSRGRRRTVRHTFSFQRCATGLRSTTDLKERKQQGRVMRVFWGLGKILTLGFWVVVLINQAVMLPNPFDVLVRLAGSLLLLTHVLELFLFNGSLRGRAQPWRDRVLILLFGIFHLQSFGRRSAEVQHA